MCYNKAISRSGGESFLLVWWTVAKVGLPHLGATWLMVKQTEVCSKNGSKLESQTKESSHNQLSVYSERADQNPGEIRTVGETIRENTCFGKELWVCLLFSLIFFSLLAFISSHCSDFFFSQLKIWFLHLHYLIAVVMIKSQTEGQGHKLLWLCGFLLTHCN